MKTFLRIVFPLVFMLGAVSLAGPTAHAAGDRVVTGQSLVVDTNEEVGDVAVMGGSLTVRGRVRGDASVTGGRMFVESTGIIEGDASAVGGGIRIAKGGRVMGDATSVGGDVVVDPGATVEGDRSSTGGNTAKVVQTLGRTFGAGPAASMWRSWNEWPAKLMRSLAFLFAAALALTIVPGRLSSGRARLETDFWRSLLVGVGLLAAAIPACVLLAITVIGILVIPLLAAAYAVALFLGYTLILWLVGERLPLLRDRKTRLLALLLGFVVVTLLDFVPIVGTVLVAGAVVAGTGALVLTLRKQGAALATTDDTPAAVG